MSEVRPHDLPRWSWLWLIWAPLVVQVAARLLMQDKALYSAIFLGELGAVETLTALLMLPPAYLAVRCGQRLIAEHHRLGGIVMFVFAALCILYMGEELSWGQHHIRWSTPEYFIQHNESQETNLHNLESVHKGMLKWILIAAITLGCLAIPIPALVKRHDYRPARHWFYWLIPTRVCIPVVLLIIVGHLVAKALRGSGAISDWDGIGIRIPENTELHISILFVLYTASMWTRMRQCDSLDKPGLVIGP